MKITRIKVMAAALLLVLGAASAAVAQTRGSDSRTEFSVMGGIQALNDNDTALPDDFINIPAVAGLAYHLTPLLAVEGEFTWMIPVEQTVDLASGGRGDRKTPDILAYQANLRGSWPTNQSWTPYLAAGAGAVTFLSNTDTDRLPALEEAETAFAINFGGGVTYGLSSPWALRADFREFVAFPSNDATGLSAGGDADQIWMSRATLGIAYRF